MAMTFEEVMAAAKALPVEDRRLLVNSLADGLAEAPSDDAIVPGRTWSSLRGSLRGALGGEDAQAFVDRLRDEWTEREPKVVSAE